MPTHLFLAHKARSFVAACATLSLLALPLTESQAALTLSNTRIIYPSDSRSTSLVVRNPSKQTFAVQAWINTEADDNVTAVPLLPSPQLFRLDPSQEQLLQINALPNDLAEDRESLFFLNVQEIPQADPEQRNALSIALRTRLKLFYRPHQLKGNPATQAHALQFALQRVDGQTRLKVHNPTPFHITFSQLSVVGDKQASKLKDLPMLAPFSDQYLALDAIHPGANLQARFGIINDFGGYTTPITQPIASLP